ncbi:TIGR00730 family Rossman fold protein [Castellaniella sp. S9]|uniref:LOG family protein n=1 Tax=Castellaniella sp. S9 TaxID=2993652 RepID=UPI0022B5A76A|nr:TIGR00730 family Rossman fold protein [Castellaniella sp. S9]
MANNKTTRVSAEQQIPTIISEMTTAAQAFRHIGLGVSVFGSARIPRGHPYYDLGIEIGARIAQLGLPMIAGGGPGLMEAANRGAYEAGGRSIGLNIRLPREKRDNTYQTDSLHFEYFYSRKASFFMHSLAYVVLPGGFGTLDEVFEAITLVQTLKQPPAPIILVGVDFWSGLMDWVRDQLLANGMISPYDLDLILVTDDLDEIVRLIQDAAQIEPNREPALPE